MDRTCDARLAEQEWRNTVSDVNYYRRKVCLATKLDVSLGLPEAYTRTHMNCPLATTCTIEAF
jgi:hypothetical protein